MPLQTDAPQTLPHLCKTAENAPDESDRAAALREIVRIGKDDPDTLAFLQSRAQSDPSTEVLRVAMEELARVWRDDPTTLNWFKTYAQYAQNPEVRSIAVKVLAREWKDEYNVFEIVSKCAFADRFQRQDAEELNPRQAALEAAIAQYTDYSQTWALLEERSENDPDRVVREFAKAELEKKQVRTSAA